MLIIEQNVTDPRLACIKLIQTKRASQFVRPFHLDGIKPISDLISLAFYGSSTLLKSTAFSTSTTYSTGGKTSFPDPPPATTE